jgi:hypothetical protein
MKLSKDHLCHTELELYTRVRDKAYLIALQQIEFLLFEQIWNDLAYVAHDRIWDDVYHEII